MKTETTLRDVVAALDHIKEGKKAARAGDAKQAWEAMDRAEARLIGLGIYAHVSVQREQA